MTPAEKSEYMRKWRAENRDKVLAAKRKWQEENPEKARESQRASYARNVHKYRPAKPCPRCGKRKDGGQGKKYCLACMPLARAEMRTRKNRKWLDENRAKVSEKNSYRRGLKIKATPQWLTKEQRKEIESIYKTAQVFNMHVDHIVPLNGENVRGLHVPWNLQLLPPAKNIAKGNKLVEMSL